jgi:hypothetical protein
MLEALVTLILVIVGAVLIVAILVYGIYVTLYPLTKTVKGGIDAIKEHAERRKKVPGKGYPRIPPPGRAHRARREEPRGVRKRGHQAYR